MVTIKRRVVLHGNSTLTVSLPSKWAKKHKIVKGSELEVKEYENFLKVIKGKEPYQIKKINVNFADLSEELINSILPVLYKSGYDEIEAIFNNSRIIEAVKERVNSTLIGYEIIEQRRNRFLIENVTGNQNKEFDKMLRRIFIISLELAKNSLAFVRSNEVKINDVLALEKANNRLTTFCHRLLNKKKYKDEKTIYLYHIIWLIESIADDYRDITLFFNQNKEIKLSKELLTLYEKINNIFDMYYNLFYKYSNQEMDRLRKEHRNLKEFQRILKFKTKMEVILGMYLFSITQRIYDCLGSTTGLHY